MTHDHNDNEGEHKGHHILSNKTGLRILGALLGLTVLTVVSSRIDLGALNAPIAILIASVKALLVVLFFMGLKYDANENRAFFASSFVFFLLFVVLTMCDVFTRDPNWRV